MIYQMIIKQLKEFQENGVDIGTAIKYCSDNIFDLVVQHEQMAVSVDALVQQCIKYGTESEE
ncbi:hypothetical protein DQT32_04215 [Salmonella enterica subsp. enterica serovar Braenderup]|nr:hypothetical protein [Salmonella enterica subsp. enterica serovar Braenderup]